MRVPLQQVTSGSKPIPAKTKRKRGAPPGNSNALKHGKYTRARRALYAEIRAHIERCDALIAALGLAGDCSRDGFRG